MAENALSERDICTKFITPAVEQAGRDVPSQVREEVSLTAGKVLVRGKLVARGKSKRADYVLYWRPNVPLAVIEAKEPERGVGDGMQQALEYAEMLGVPFAFSSNGKGFLAAVVREVVAQMAPLKAHPHGPAKPRRTDTTSHRRPP